MCEKTVQYIRTCILIQCVAAYALKIINHLHEEVKKSIFRMFFTFLPCKNIAVSLCPGKTNHCVSFSNAQFELSTGKGLDSALKTVAVQSVLQESKACCVSSVSMQLKNC